MTISYTAQVASSKGFGFLKLLGRWKGSVYKLVWMDLIVFLCLYYTLSFIYRFALNDLQKGIFECIVYHCKSYGTLIPLSFVLGFYVNLVMQRWWDQYMYIPWPDPLAVFVSAHIHGLDERSRVMRRTIMRYTCLCHTMVLTMISPSAKKRFPTLEHLVEAGLLLENEKLILQDMNAAFPKYPKHWMPIVWAASIVTRARKEGRIRDDIAVKTIIDELNAFRGGCGALMFYDVISIPLVYTQVVTLAVYTYFLCSNLGYQWTDERSEDGYLNYVDYYFPVFTTLQFFFYMGWLKVAESLINPFGDDDDDFEVNWMIDRNLQVSYLIVDEMHHEHPELLKDQYWDEMFPTQLPNAAAPAQLPTAAEHETKHAPSAHIIVESEDSEISGMKTVQDIHNSRIRHSEFARQHAQTRSQLNLQRRISFNEEGELQVHSTNSSETDEEKTLTAQNRNTLPSLQGVFPSKTRPSQAPTQDGSFKSLLTSGDEDDEFERLRHVRERERLERQKQKLTQNLISTAQAASPGSSIDTTRSRHSAEQRASQSKHSHSSNSSENTK